MTSRKARRFRAIFARNFLKIHTFFIKYWYFWNYHVIKRIWNEFSFHTVFMKLVVCVYIPSPKARGYKTHNSFHKYRMKWKFISDPIYIVQIAKRRTSPVLALNMQIPEQVECLVVFVCWKQAQDLCASLLFVQYLYVYIYIYIYI